MATVNFNLKEGDSRKETFIYLRFYYNNQRFKFYTTEKIVPSRWNFKSQRAKAGFTGSIGINDLLDKYEEAIKEIFRTRVTSGKKLSVEYLKDELSKAMQNDSRLHKTNFFEVMDGYIQEKKSVYSANYLKKVTTLKNHLVEFEKKKRFSVTFDKIDINFLQKFTSFLLNDQKHLNSTIKSLFSVLKTFLVWSTENGFNLNLKYRESNFKNLPSNFKYESSVIYLTETELMNLFNLDLSDNKRLHNVRETFCFGCFTGMRFSDIVKIRKENVQDDILHFVTQKTKDGLSIPLNDYAKEILIRNQYKLPVISNQKTNDNLKDLGELAEIKESVIITKFKGVEAIEIKEPKFNFITSHTARRTFVTLSLEKGMRAETVMEITGHKDYKTFKKYVKITDKVKVIEMNQVWRKIPELKKVV